ncbi:DUF3575 domain-containing protein [Hymenobacter sp. 15J16-1T3B]|uniref:DUF3575 domain-containing protein n=1 Tax=Hymenobacter sp. 15J16-1T3B TaxID=2886941 RepID=UPI001D10EFB0|nr:DUF3575 domain-containing protein [Hymenobacter sp. 15J16-1T3B]MCC3159065.1 DUF3575 domain-containing protein [Hymenobacter sp. 15J16-1T3B]
MHLRAILNSAAALLIVQAAHAQAPVGPTPARTHHVKLGLHATSGKVGLLPTLAYEAQLTSRFTLEASAGYKAYAGVSGYDYVARPDSVYSYRSNYRQRQVVATVHGRYYFSSQHPAQIGWYAGLGLQGHYYDSHTTVTAGGSGEVRTRRFTLSPQLRLGRQWALGQRLSLDTYLGLQQDVLYRTTALLSPGFLRASAGLQLGYRF